VNDELIYHGQFDFGVAMAMFPELILFAPVTSETLGRMIAGLLYNVTTPDRLQDILDSDEFCITLAGSVYCQVIGNPKFGCDGGDRNGR